MQHKLDMFENRLTKVYKHLNKLAKRQNLTCYRIYDKDLPEFPLIIDIYGSSVHVAEYKSNHKLDETEYNIWLQSALHVIAKVVKVSNEYIYLKQRKRIIDRTNQYQKLEESNTFFEVQENKLKFLVNLSDFLDTGLFLDHRITRQMVQAESNGKKVLNLFCYTGSFSVYAAAGGAAQVTSIDLSNTYIDWAQRNMTINNLYNQSKHQFIKADVLQYIPKLPNHYYDIIVLDPPTFSNSKMMKDVFDVQRDHVALINLLLNKMTDGGIMYFSNNFTQFTIETDNIKASTITDITKQTTPFDFEKKLKRCCYKIIK
jgi:23S rRNA (cytosine1962-C5)-methyltransferase